MNLSWSVTVEWLQFLGAVGMGLGVLALLGVVIFAAVQTDKDAGNIEP